LTKDPDCLIENLTRPYLEKRGLSNDKIEELMQIKEMWLELESGLEVDTNHLIRQLLRLEDELRADATHTKVQHDWDKLDSSYDKKIFDADILRNIVLDIPERGHKITQEQRDNIAKSVRDVMGGITGDFKIDPLTVTVSAMKKLGLTEHEIQEMLKLRHIYDEVEGPGEIDNKKLTDELKEVMDEIRNSAEASRHEKDILEKGDSADHREHDADILRDMVLDMPVDGPLGVDQKIKLEKSIRDIIGDIAHDPKIDP
jgi:hypothetical protein